MPLFSEIEIKNIYLSVLSEKQRYWAKDDSS